MSNVHIYCRVSGLAQAEGHSLNEQERAGRAWAGERGLTVASVAREVGDSENRDRPQLNAAIDRLRPGDVFLVYNQDRFSRGGPVDMFVLRDRIEQTGASFHYMTGEVDRSDWGPLKETVDAIIAQREKADIRRRTQGGRRARVADGKPIPGGKPPFGYLWVDAGLKKGGCTRLAIDPMTAPVVRRIFALALAGNPLRAIVRALSADGIPSPLGKDTWTADGVRRILTREIYSTGAWTAFAIRYERKPGGKGYRQVANDDADQVTIPDIAPPLVSREDQAAVLARLATNKAFATRNNPFPEATLLRAGFVRCGHCGWALRVNAPTTRNGARYCCSSYRAGRCANPTITAAALDAAVWAKVRMVILDPRLIEEEAARRRDDGGLERDLAAVEKMLAAIAGKQKRTASAIAAVDDDDAAEPLIAELKSLGERKKAAEREREDLQRRIADAEGDLARVKSLADWCATVAQNLDSLTYDEKRRALEAFGVQVHVWREDAVRDDGTPQDRWQLTMQPRPGASPIVFPATSSTNGS